MYPYSMGWKSRSGSAIRIYTQGSSLENIKSQLVLNSSWDSLFALSLYRKKTGNLLLFLYSKCVCHLINEGGSGVISVSTPSSCCYWNQNICTFAMTLLFYVLETLIYALNRLESAFHSFRDDPEFEVSLPV